MTEIAPELVERMVALVRRMTGKGWDASNIEWNANNCAEARKIVGLLDFDLKEARKLAFDFAGTTGKRPEGILDGDMDDTEAVRALLAAIKRGRELERGTEDRQHD